MSDFAPYALTHLDFNKDSGTAGAYNVGVLFDPRLEGLAVALSGRSPGELVDSHYGLAGSVINVNPHDKDLEIAIKYGMAQEELGPLMSYLEYEGVEIDIYQVRILYLLRAMGRATVLQDYIDENHGNTQLAFDLFYKERKQQIATLPLGASSSDAQNAWNNNYNGYRDEMVRLFGFDDSKMQEALIENTRAFYDLPHEKVINRFALGVLANIRLNRDKLVPEVNIDYLESETPANEEPCIDIQTIPVNPEVSSNRQRLVELLINDPTAQHALTGKFGKSVFDGYRCVGTKAGSRPPTWDPCGRTSDKSIPFANIQTIDKEYGMLVPQKPSATNRFTGLENFQGVVFKIYDKKDERYVFVVRYPDPKSKDRKHGVYTQYSLRLPESSPFITAIEKDPTLLLDMMRTAFPEADRSTEDQPLRLANQPIDDLTKKVANRKY